METGESTPVLRGGPIFGAGATAEEGDVNTEEAGAVEGGEREQTPEAAAAKGGGNEYTEEDRRARKRITVVKTGPCYACFYCGITRACFTTPQFSSNSNIVDPSTCWYQRQYGVHRWEPIPCVWCRRLQHTAYTKCPGATVSFDDPSSDGATTTDQSDDSTFEYDSNSSFGCFGVSTLQ